MTATMASTAACPAATVARYWRTAAALARTTADETEIGATPAKVLFRRDKITLRRHQPPKLPGDTAPLLIVHGLVGRASVADLDARRSLVGALGSRGVDVWSIDWGSPSRADRDLAIDDYLEDYLSACVGHVTAEVGRPPALLGVCEGGVFAACFAALWPSRIAGVALAVTPIDFHADPSAIMTRWTRAFQPETLSRLIDVLGYLPGGMMGAIFESLSPSRTIAKYTAGLSALDGDPARVAAFLRMERWLSDRPHHPGAAAKQLLIELYHDNQLARGVFRLCGRTVDLGDITTPVLVVCGRRDHIVPPAQACAIGPLLRGAAYEQAIVEAGHIGVFVSAAARGVLAGRLADWLEGQVAAASGRGGGATRQAER